MRIKIPHKRGMLNKSKSSRILLIEDNPADARLTKTLLEKHGNFQIEVLTTATEALRYLRKDGKYSEALIPHLILLDLNLPEIDGFKFLKEVREIPIADRVPVVVLSTSSNPNDVQRAYELKANCYVSKSYDLDDFETKIRNFVDFWFQTAVIPQ